MWLAIDVGNTNTHIGVFEKRTLLQTVSVKNDIPQILTVSLTQALDYATFSKIQDAVISSVNPKAYVTVTEYLEGHLRIKPKVIGKDTTIPVQVLTDRPENVGMDRLMNALAAFERTQKWTIVIDAGTAITIDAVNDVGAFAGGIIAPGIEMSSRAMNYFTALLPKATINKPKHILGKNTEEAICSGIYWGTIGMVNKLIDMLYNELNCQPVVIATGGNAALLAEEIPIITAVVPHLTLEGIMITCRKNNLLTKYI